MYVNGKYEQRYIHVNGKLGDAYRKEPRYIKDGN